jgi:tyrosinase
MQTFGLEYWLIEILTAFNSPGDPLFYLHHGNLDRLYYLWQKKDLANRLRDVSGPIQPFDYLNEKAGNVTLEFEINMAPLTGNIKLKDLMSTRGTKLCYKYDDN